MQEGIPSWTVEATSLFDSEVEETPNPVVVVRKEDHDKIVAALNKRISWLDSGSIHTCHDECQRTTCVQYREIEALKAALIESKGCWDAAYAEGLPDAMNEARNGDATRLLDLLDRRLLYALAPIVDVLQKEEKTSG